MIYHGRSVQLPSRSRRTSGFVLHGYKSRTHIHTIIIIIIFIISVVTSIIYHDCPTRRHRFLTIYVHRGTWDAQSVRKESVGSHQTPAVKLH
jgi:hypothetical protein